MRNWSMKYTRKVVGKYRLSQLSDTVAGAEGLGITLGLANNMEKRFLIYTHEKNQLITVI